MDKSIFRAYDIRGIAEAKDENKIQINEETAELIGQAVASYLIQKYNVKSIAIGRDTRKTGEKIEKGLINGISKTGLKIYKLGQVPTPFCYFSTFQNEIDSAISITASHNPAEYNGFKLIGKNGHSICAEEIEEIVKIIEEKNFVKNQNSEITELSILEKYTEKILETKHSKSLKIGLDCQNGAFSNYAKEILEKMGHEIIQIHANVNDTFPYKEANPVNKENIEKLSILVKEKNLDLGIAFDGDGDRLGVITKTGELIDANHLLLILSKYLIQNNGNLKVVVDVTTSQVIINEIEKTGATIFISKTGNNNIEAKMKEINGDIGAESSGHFFIQKGFFGFDDGLFVATKIFSYIIENGNNLDEEVLKIPKSEITPNIYLPCPDDKKITVIEMLKEFLSKYEQDFTDGIRIKFNHLDWGIVRASNTSPNLTFRVEAQNKEDLKQYTIILYNSLKKSGYVDTLELEKLIN